MKISLTREDIERNAKALSRIKDLENVKNGRGSEYRQATFHLDGFQLTVDCGCARKDDQSEKIFRKHIEAAVDEAIDYWKKQADLDE